MRNLFFIAILLIGCSAPKGLQKAKLISVTNLIDSGRFSEAKEVLDEMTANPESAKWAKTWYLKGNLCQTAHREGLRKNDRALTELYPNQLSEAFLSYQMALKLDRGGKLERQVASKLSVLANQLQELGERKFADRQYGEATLAFEHAYAITQSNILSVQPDPNLLFNAGLSAFEAKEWDGAIKHFQPLHKSGFNSNVTHLLYNAYLQKTDTLSARRVLFEGTEMHGYPEELVLLLTDLLYRRNELAEMHNTLGSAITKNPNNVTLHYTLGLALQKQEQYSKAAEAYTEALRVSPGHLQAMVNLATCYYNLGVEALDRSRSASGSTAANEEKKRAAEWFGRAGEWLAKAKEIETDNPKAIVTINDLDRNLRQAARNR